MNGIERVQYVFQEYRRLLNEGLLPQAGVWGRVTKTQAATVLALHGTLITVAVLQGRSNLLWFFAVAIMCGFGTVMPAYLLRERVEGASGEAPSGYSFAAWSAASVILGIPTGHLILHALVLIHPIGEKPLPLTYLPELTLVYAMVYAYWRFVSVRQWQYKLDTERLKREVAEHGQALAQAQLKMLQAQIEPHFLYNTLASVQHLVRKDPQLADYLLSQLVTYLREAMPDIRGMGSTLGREFGLVGAYLNIAKVRMGGRLEIEVNIPPELTGLAFPSLVTQTLVENALKHGVEPKQGPVKISVSAAEVIDGANCFVEIQVLDNGVGFGVSQILGTGIGLRNVRERLAGLYGGSARLTVSDTSPSGVNATIRIPK